MSSTKDITYVSANDASNAVVHCAHSSVLGRSGSAPNLESATSEGAVIVMGKVYVGGDVAGLKEVSFTEGADKLEVLTIGGAAGESEPGMCQITQLSVNSQSGAIGSMSHSGNMNPSYVVLRSTVQFWSLVLTKLGNIKSSSSETTVYVKIEEPNKTQMYDFTGNTVIQAAFTNSGDNMVLSCPIGTIKDAVAHMGLNMEASVEFISIYSATVGFSDQDNKSLACVVNVGGQ